MIWILYNHAATTSQLVSFSLYKEKWLDSISLIHGLTPKKEKMNIHAKCAKDSNV